MMKTYFLLSCILWLWAASALAQSEIKGKITDASGEGLAGVNVYLKNTYDGTSTDASGNYTFKTTETSTQSLVATFVGYKPAEMPIEIKSGSQEVNLKLEEEQSELNTVTITAGSFEASDERKSVILRPLDIFTTAGANSDIAVAMQTLPGAQRVGDAEGLFVRGGSAYETKTIIDGTIVENPFFSSMPDVPQRSRFSPALFKGTFFSTGGYSAQYGQALSSVMVLNSKDLPDSSKTDVGLMVVGGYLSRTQRWKNTSVLAEGTYTNLGPFFKIVPQNVEWPKVPQAYSGMVNVKHKPTDNSILKVHSNYSRSNSALKYQDFENIDQQNTFAQINNNIYINSSYQNSFDDGKWVATGGASYSYNKDDMDINADQSTRHEERTQVRGTLSRSVGENSSILTGAEIHSYTFGNSFNEFTNELHDTYSAAFLETEVYITRKLAGRIGIRGEYSQLLSNPNISPRTSLAYKTGDYSQVSMAYGQFYQSPENRYLYTNRNLGFEKATHYILNYQIMKNRRTFRAEAYYKDYTHLVKEHNQTPFDPNRFRQPTGETDNGGNGYAQGIDFFWRDQQTIDNVDYWISYSFLDTKRNYQNFPAEAMPSFASKHNISVVYKQFITAISSMIGVTYNFASGRPYYNPHADEFMSDFTKPYHGLNMSISYLTQIRGNFTVIFASANNVLGTENVFGYRYSTDGSRRIAVGQPANRGFFLGMFISIGAGFEP